VYSGIHSCVTTVKKQQGRLFHSQSRLRALICSQLQLNLGNSSGRVQTLGAGTGAIEDRVTPIQAHLILQLLLSLGTIRIPGVGYPSIRLHQGSGTEVFVLVPPIRWAGRGATRAQNAFVQSVELLTVVWALEEFAFLRWVVILEVWLNGFVLFVEER